MGGTLRMLVENGNVVHVSYMTPGYTAVFDHAVRNEIIFRKRFAVAFGLDEPTAGLYGKVLSFLDEKSSSGHSLPDIPEVLAIKRLIRETEAISCCNYVGVHSFGFENLPFYQTGRARKMPVGEEDVAIVKKTIEKHKPDIIFAAGDLTDPNGTHRLCLSAINQATAGLENKPEMWLYSGAWKEFHPSEADALVPLSQAEVESKKVGIFRHESQKNKPPNPGHMPDGTEFWQMAEKRNAATARLLGLYGLGEYTAMEAFKIIK